MSDNQNRRAPAGYPSGTPDYAKKQDQRLTDLVEAIAKLRSMEVLPKDTRGQKLSKIHDALMAEFGLNPKLSMVRITPDTTYSYKYDPRTPVKTIGFTSYSGKNPGPLTKLEIPIRDYAPSGEIEKDTEAYNSLVSTLAHELMHAREMSSYSENRFKELEDESPKHFKTQQNLYYLPIGVDQQKEEYLRDSDPWLERALTERIERLKRPKEEQDMIDLMGDVVK